MSALLSRLICFFALSYAFTWFGSLGNWIWPSDAWPVPMNPIGPFLAAFVVVLSFGGWPAVREWLGRILVFRAPPAVYAISFFGPLAIIFLSVWLAWFAGAKTQPPPLYSAGQLLMFIPVVLIEGPAPEEVSFRGYGLHHLQEFVSPLAASVLVGLGVIVWHLPLIISGELPLAILAALCGVAVVYGWLYQIGGSVWPLVVLHFVQNYVGGGLASPMMVDQQGQILFLAVLGGFYLLWAVALVAVHGVELGRVKNPTVRSMA